MVHAKSPRFRDALSWGHRAREGAGEAIYQEGGRKRKPLPNSSPPQSVCSFSQAAPSNCWVPGMTLASFALHTEETQTDT